MPLLRYWTPKYGPIDVTLRESGGYSGINEAKIEFEGTVYEPDSDDPSNEEYGDYHRYKLRMYTQHGVKGLFGWINQIVTPGSDNDWYRLSATESDGFTRIQDGDVAAGPSNPIRHDENMHTWWCSYDQINHYDGHGELVDTYPLDGTQYVTGWDVGPQRIYIAYRGEIYCIRRSDGVGQWSLSYNNPYGSAGVAIDTGRDRVFHARDDSLVEYDTTVDPPDVSFHQIPHTSIHGLAVNEATGVVGIGCDEAFVTYDPSDGTWNSDTTWASGNTIQDVAAATAYTDHSYPEGFLAVKSGSYSTLARFDTTATSEWITTTTDGCRCVTEARHLDRDIYIGTNDGYLYEYDNRGSFKTSWKHPGDEYLRGVETLGGRAAAFPNFTLEEL